MPLLCPRTGSPMEDVVVGGVQLNISTRCGGIWFDNWELAKFDEADEEPGEELIARVERYAQPVTDAAQRLKCPRCDNLVMMRRFFGVRMKVEIDECPGCAGTWLDPGELGAIRKNYPTEAERRAEAEHFVEELLGSVEFQSTRSEEGDHEERVVNLVRRLLMVPRDRDRG